MCCVQIAGGAVGLVFSVPQLVNDCQNLDNIETKASQTLRKNARTVLTNAEETDKELQKIRYENDKTIYFNLRLKHILI